MNNRVVADVLESVADIVDKLQREKQAAYKRASSVAAETAPVNPALVSKLAARWDRNEEEVLAELKGLSSTLLEDLEKMASENHQESIEELNMGGPSEYDTPNRKKQATSSMSKEEVWKTVTERWLSS